MHIIKRTFVLVTFLSPYILHLPSSVDVCALILISTCAWIQEATLESNQVKLSMKEKELPSLWFLEIYMKNILCWYAFLKYENLYILSPVIYKYNHASSFKYTAVCCRVGHSMERRIISGRGHYSSNALKCRSAIKPSKVTHPSFQMLPALCKLKPLSSLLPYLNYSHYLCIF